MDRREMCVGIIITLAIAAVIIAFILTIGVVSTRNARLHLQETAACRANATGDALALCLEQI